MGDIMNILFQMSSVKPVRQAKWDDSSSDVTQYFFHFSLPFAYDEYTLYQKNV